MNSGSAVIGAILLLVLVVPFVLLYHNKKRKEKKKLNALRDIAQKQHCEINEYEICSDFIIGIDNTKDFVFFIKKGKHDEASLVVDLSKIQTVKAMKGTRPLPKEDGDLLADIIELTFIPKDKKEAEIRFELFDGEKNVNLGGELQLVDKWSVLINDRIKNRK